MEELDAPHETEGNVTSVSEFGRDSPTVVSTMHQGKQQTGGGVQLLLYFFCPGPFLG